VKSLCLDLLRADSEQDIIRILKDAGFWDDSKSWRLFGDNESNWSIIGSQASKPEAAIVEKVINSVDHRLMLECQLRGMPLEGAGAPAAIREAVALFFEGAKPPFKTTAGKISEWDKPRRTEVARGITFAATGAAAREGNPCFTICDAGEGQSPLRVPDTLLSLPRNRSNKARVPFVQGKFNMGGTGVLKFCGEHKFELIITRRHPELAARERQDPSDDNWGFTIVRREFFEAVRNSVYTYLAPIDADIRPRGGNILHFAADELPVFPEGRDPYARPAKWGTCIKLYEYMVPGSKGHMLRSDGMLSRMELLLPDIALPVRLHECRAGYRGHKGSFDTTLTGLSVRLNDDRSDNLEPEFPFQTFIRARGEQMMVTVYAFKKDKAGAYRKNEGVIFALNGQAHGTLSKDFFARKAAGRLGYIAESLLVVVDCSEFSIQAQEDFIMNSRDRLSGGDLRVEIETSLEDFLRSCERLRELKDRRQQEATTEILDDARPLEKILESVMKQNPTLSALFLKGMRISNPHDTTNTKAGPKDVFKGKQHPTFFQFKDREYGKELRRSTPQNHRCGLAFKTDAVDDYFTRAVNPGAFTVHRTSGALRAPVETFSGPELRDGFASVRVKLPPNAQVADELRYVAVVQDPMRDEPFENPFSITVAAPVKQASGGPPSPQPPKGPDDKGKDEPTAAGIAMPNIIPIHRDKWGAQEPPFDKYTALRIVISEASGNGSAGQDVYDFFVNMDNLYLLNEEKVSKDDVRILRARFQYGLVLLGLALIHQDKQNRTDREDHEAKEEDTRGEESEGGRGEEKPQRIERRVEEVTKALAAVLLPTISSLGSLEIEMPIVIDDSGEAA
jgi:hypothetical protein